MIKYIDIQQGSQEWLDYRKGKLTASNATAIGANGAGLNTYCKSVAIESLGVEKTNYINADMERGNELEPIAISAYEFQYSLKIDTVGCIENDKYQNVLASPDGLIGNDGGCEIKAKNDEKHLSLIIGETKEIPYNQIQMSLLISEREWWDFISINTNFSKPLFVKRIYPDTVYFNKLKTGFETGRKLINEYIKKYNEYSL